MSAPFGPPQFVSPLIRGARFGLLILGFFYAQGKQRLYNSMEVTRKQEEAKKKKIRDEQMVIIRAKIAEEEKKAVKLLESGKLFDPD